MIAAWTRRPAVQWVLVGLVTLTGALLRFHDFGRAPAFTDNLDELQFSWAGLNLLEHGDAYTWSFFTAYPRPVPALQAYGVSVPMVHHWLDHPPGFSLLMGSYLWLIGDRSMLGLTPEHVRVLPVLFAVAAIPLAYLLARRALGAHAALAGAVLLATAPAAVLMARQAEPESVLAPLLLGALLIASRHADCAARPWEIRVLVLMALVAPLFKVTGIAVGGTAAVVLLMNGRRWAALWSAGAAAAGLAAYFAYGALVDWPLFQRVLMQQAANRHGLLAALNFITAPAGINRPLHDGWWVLGWIALGLLLVGGRRSRAEQVLAWPAFAYLLVIMVLAGEVLTAQYGWYRVILQPLVYVAAGALAWRSAVSPSPARLAAVLALGGASALNWAMSPDGTGWVPNPALAAALLAAVLLPAALVAWPRFGRHSGSARAIALAAMAVLVTGNIVTSLELADVFARL